MGINYRANRPDPDNPGGLGAEESGVERTGPTHPLLFAIQMGSRWAEIGQYYDSTNDPVTAYFRSGQDPPGQSARAGIRTAAPRRLFLSDGATAPLAAARGWRNHVVEMTEEALP
jgi:hypothetical protein